MVMSRVSSEVLSIIMEKFDLEESAIASNPKLVELGADSLDIVELMIDIENEFNLYIPESDANNLRSIEDIIRYIEIRSNQ